MLHSLRLRLLLTMIVVVAVTAGTVAALARAITMAEFERYISCIGSPATWARWRPRR
ncbi:MAG: hypothetical protein AB4911_07050 [Oscillochloridaceae bacterium umkhey_bin13]